MAKRIELWPVSKLVAYDKNPRTHSRAQVSQLAASIVEFGFVNPVLVDGDAGVIAGHGRLAAAKELGLTEVPVVVLDHLSAAQKRAYVIADNKLAELAGWDMSLLSGELADLRDFDFDLELTGFSDAELGGLLDDVATNVPTPTFNAPTPGTPGTPLAAAGASPLPDSPAPSSFPAGVVDEGDEDEDEEAFSLPPAATRVVQLFMSLDQHTEWGRMIDRLNKHYGTSNQTDCVFAALKDVLEGL
jgi:hypothetical protein